MIRRVSHKRVGRKGGAADVHVVGYVPDPDVVAAAEVIPKIKLGKSDAALAKEEDEARAESWASGGPGVLPEDVSDDGGRDSPDTYDSDDDGVAT